MINKAFIENEPKETLKEAIDVLNKINFETFRRGNLTIEEEEKILNDMISLNEKEKLKRFLGISSEARQEHLDLLKRKFRTEKR